MDVERVAEEFVSFATEQAFRPSNDDPDFEAAAKRSKKSYSLNIIEMFAAKFGMLNKTYFSVKTKKFLSDRIRLL